MISLFGFIYIVFLSILQDSTCSGLQKSSTEVANEYINKLLKDTIEENKHKLEPYRPGNTSLGFEQKIFLITLTGNIELYDMTVSGLTSVHRDGDCIRSSEGGISKISVNLGMGVLHLYSKAHITFMNYGPTVDLNGKIGYVLVHLEASRDDNAGTPPSIDDFKIYNTKGEEATISGLGPLNYVANKITSVFITFFKGMILSKAEEKLRVALDEMIKTTNFPLID